MNPLEILSNEHGLIRQYLDNLAVAAEKIEAEQYPPREFFDKAVEFARTFADKFHHFKEEHVLFVRVAQKHSGELDDRIDTLRLQHERGREMVNAIANSLDGYEERNEMKVAEMLENLAAYVSLLRRHIHVEDHVFYPLAEGELTADEMEALAEEFRMARERAGEDTFEASHKLVVDMGSTLVHM